jgi:recombination protein RecA
VDVEHALDAEYAAKLGVDVDNLLVAQPDSAEQALNIIEEISGNGQVSIIVLDSIAALVTEAEINGESGDSFPGLNARLVGQAVRKLVPIIEENNTALIFINQIRYKIGVMYGSPETTPGGASIKYAASMRLDIRRTGTIKNGEEPVGNRTKVKVVKNKLAPPLKEAEFDIIFGEGISKEGDLIDLALKSGALVARGSWFSRKNQNIGQGRENIRKMLKEDQNLYNEILEEVKTSL